MLGAQMKKPRRGGVVNWWVLTGSNRRHSPCKGDALPTELSTRLRLAQKERQYIS